MTEDSTLTTNDPPEPVPSSLVLVLSSAHAGAIRTTPLPARGVVSIGRSGDCAIAVEEGKLQVTITDDGHGLSEKNKFGNGLKNISRRMIEAGGQATFVSEHGLEVRLQVPVA